MKIQQILLAGATTIMLLTTGPVWAERGGENRPHVEAHEHGHGHGDRHGHGHWHGHVKAPEIDAASGTSAIALLAGALLLAGERSRSRRS
ncbi:VPEID-CTERM sorting domain-containing protein [Methylobacter tundripaludum]|uniref:VPEID-CTERM sorting domain-containing protein n=1 Tax=Methylobacter tundripaludum TaxID=173365 RepID=UPI0004822C5B